MGFHLCLRDSKSPQVPRTLLRIQVDLSVPLLILWGLLQVYLLQMVLPSPSCSIVFFSFRARSRHLSLFSLSFNFTLWSAGTAKSTIFGLVVWLRLGNQLYFKISDYYLFVMLLWECPFFTILSHQPLKTLHRTYTLKIIIIIIIIIIIYIYIYICIYIYIYIYIYIRGAFNKLPDFLYRHLHRHLKLSYTLENSLCYCYTSYEMTE